MSLPFQLIRLTDGDGLRVKLDCDGAVTHFGKEVHYDGAKDEEVIVPITGEGPGTNTPVEIAK